MKEYPELSYIHLKRYCDIGKYNFETTEQVPCLKGIMGQSRAEESMEFGLQIDHPSYNIYISGAKGTGRTTYAKNIVKQVAKLKPIPDDWCYVHSFDLPGKAVALNLPAGMGKEFQRDMNELMEELLVQVPRAFNSEDYDRQKNEIIKKYQEQKNKLLQYLSAYASERNFIIKSTSTGFTFTPLLEDGEEMTEEDAKELDEDEKIKLESQLEEIHERALEILTKIKNLERLAKKKLLQLEMRVGLFVVKPLMDDLIKKYTGSEKVIKHLKRVEKDLIENIHEFDSDEEEEVIDVAKKMENEEYIKRYKVNLFVDHSKTQGAPVVMEFNPILSNLVGRIEYENVNGNLRTDFLHIKPGAIHLANGGYLIVEAKQLLSSPYAWETLKRILQTKTVTVENMANRMGVVDVASLKLEPIPVHLKVILIGSGYLYHLLYHYDEDFEKYFKILVDFDDEMNRTQDHEWQMVQFVSGYVNQEGIRPITAQGVARIIEYSSRLANNQHKLSARFNKIIEIIIEASQWAENEKSSYITDQHIDQAIHKKWLRLNKYQERVEEMFHSEKILIDVKGEKIGVINGLSVINLGEYTFGKPSVITVTTALGKEGIVNIEREVNLSGDIYDKGVMILSGFLAEKFAQDKRMALSARICFEQSYGGVDGDSASSAELYGLLSSIGKIPIKQYIAVTGSVNQKGFIQPVGGINEKIEGFYSLCKKRGLTGKQGVMIPYQNIDDLMLCDEVIEAVKKDQFHIYAVKHINEGIEVLTDEAFEVVYQRVDQRLREYSIRMDGRQGQY